LADEGGEIAQDPAAPDLVNELLGRIAMAVGADRATLSRVDGESAVIEGSFDVTGVSAVPGSRWPITSADFRQKLLEGRPVVETFDPSTLPSPFREQLAGVRHTVTIPLHFDQDILGTIVVSRRRDQGFEARDVATLEELGHMAVLALHNALLADQAQKSGTQLRTSEERFRLLVDSVKDYAIFMLDPRGYVTSWNQGAERIKGYRATEIIGRHFSIFYPAEDRAAGEPARGLTAARREGRFEAEGWRVRKDGTRFWASVVITALKDESDQLRGFAKVTRDITERKQLQDQQLEAERREVDRLRELADRMASLERSKSEFLKLASHELRTPAAILAGYLSLFADGDLGALNERGERAVSIMRGQARELTLLIGQMLEAARMQQGKLVLQVENFDLREVAAKAATWAQDLVSVDHHITVTLPPEPIGIRADPARILTILQSLLGNAIKYSPKGGEIVLAAKTGSGSACVQVTDGGLGMHLEQLEGLFQPFGRIVTNETADIAGVGLGLYIAQELARLQGGQITVESDRGRGSTFTLTIPITSSETPSSELITTVGVQR
jgi:PAS domain S-box-containing protein